MTLYCSQGHFNTSDSRFCRLCGEALQPASVAPPEPTQLLGWRYRVLSQLGQGGFGRTYLAQDTNRFDELCVLKEFAPQVEGDQALQKAEELFEREAGTLHQLQHDQIPRFRELFRSQWQGRERLFLVQDYVEGQTYCDLLKTRRSQAQTFSEAEVVELMLQLLPVLVYIHSLGVIHRDISPDNLIQRSPDGLPVLIDYGGVKQIAAKVVSQNAAAPIQLGTVTRLGKMGYAPAEQLEQGEVYPHSDLYALAVMVLVLLTGKEPPDLFGGNGGMQRQGWQQQVSLSPKLTAIVARMLDPYPAKRYQSAAALQEAIKAAGYGLFNGYGSINLVEKRPVQAAPPQPIPVFAPEAATIAVAPKGVPKVATIAKPIPLQRGRGKAIVNLLLLSGLIAGGWLVGVKWLGPALKLQLPEIVKPSGTKPKPKPSATPAAEYSKVERERKQQVDIRRRQLGIDTAFLVALVNEAFYRQHPELAGQKLGTGAADANLRAQWDGMALQSLKRLETLSSAARSRLGQYTDADVRDRQASASQLNLSGRALNDLTDAAFFQQFPEYSRGENFLNQSIGQVWQAIGVDQLQALQSGKTLERVEFPADNFSHRVGGVLKPGEGKAYIASLGEKQTLRLQLQAPSQSTYLSLYPPTSKSAALLEDSREVTWSGKVAESGYYEVVVVSSAKGLINYTINFAAADELGRSAPILLCWANLPQRWANL